MRSRSRSRADGCDVVVNYASSEAAAKETADAVESAGRRAVVVGGDVADAATSARLVAVAATELGGLDVWVNNAGVSVLAPIVDTSVADMEHMLAVNYMGTFHGVQAAARTMIASSTPGRIVNVASEAAVQTFRYLGAYAASKFAVVGLTQAAALELGPYGITRERDRSRDHRDRHGARRAPQRGGHHRPRAPTTVRAGYLATIPLGRFCSARRLRRARRVARRARPPRT